MENYLPSWFSWRWSVHMSIICWIISYRVATCHHWKRSNSCPIQNFYWNLCNLKINVNNRPIWYKTCDDTVEITFILPKLNLKKSTKKQLNFSNSIFCSKWETIFHLSFPKVFYKSILLSTKNVAFWRRLLFPKAYSKCVLLCSVRHMK